MKSLDAKEKLKKQKNSGVINENGRDKHESWRLETLENKIQEKKERREQERLRRWMDGERREGRDGERGKCCARRREKAGMNDI